jgi:two-component system OmpR family response regulator
MKKSARVLVADDDSELLAVVSDVFADLGFDVARVGNGSELIGRLAADGPFDLIVTDISMPWMDGLKTVRSLRSAGVMAPVIVMTALRDPTIAAHVRALGSNAILLRKPFDLSEITAAAEMLVPAVRPQKQSVHPRAE